MLPKTPGRIPRDRGTKAFKELSARAIELTTRKDSGTDPESFSTSPAGKSWSVPQYPKGKIRWVSGKIEEGEWLIIGSEGSAGLALQSNDQKKIIHIPAKGKFLKARLQPTKEKWDLIKITGWARTENPVYFLDGKKWHFAGANELVWGQVLGNGIQLLMDDG